MSLPIPRLASLTRTAVAALFALTALWSLTTAAEARPTDTGQQVTSTAPAYEVVPGDDHVAPDAQQVDRVLADLRAERAGVDAPAAADVDTAVVAIALAAAAVLLAAGAMAVTVRRTPHPARLTRPRSADQEATMPRLVR